MTKQSLSNWLLFLLLSLVWGSSFILMKKSAEELTGWQIGSLRIFAAGVAFLPFAVFHVFRIPFRKLPLVILSGILGNLFPAFLFAVAIEKSINSSLASILNSLTPLFVITIGTLFFRVRAEKNKVLGVLIGFAGLVWLTLSRGSITLSDVGFTSLILVATICYGINVNMVASRLKGIDGFYIATVSMSFIAIPAGLVAAQQQVFSLFLYDSHARAAIFLTILLGIAGSAIATAIFYVLIQKAGGLFASLVTYAIPIVAIFWGLMAGEDITVMQIGCLSLILFGVWMANRK